MTTELSKQSERYKQFMFIAYPESMGDLFSKIDTMGLMACVSPLHDKDFDGEGHLKKPHYHVMIMFTGLKSKSMCQAVGLMLGTKHIEFPIDYKQSLRYFCHLDTHDYNKHKYEPADVQCYGGFDYNSVLTARELPSKYGELVKYLSTFDFPTFRCMVDHVASNYPKWLDYLVDKAYFFYLYVNPRDQNEIK